MMQRGPPRHFPRRNSVMNRKLVAVLGTVSALLFGFASSPGADAPTVGSWHPVPAPWQSADVGAVGVPGESAERFDGDFYIAAAGSNIWGTADSLHFVYQAIGD